MANKMLWANSAHYERIIEILEDYWLTQPDELAVVVSMDFIHADGQRQSKELVWHNPNYQYTGPIPEPEPLSEIKMPPIGYKEYTALHINPADYIKKGSN